MKKSTFRRGAAVAAAAATIGAGTLVAPPPAQAGVLGDVLGGALDGIAPNCVAGEDDVVANGLGASADCTAADPSVVAKVGDAIIGLFLPGLPVDLLTSLNGATAVGGAITIPPIPVVLQDGLVIGVPASATIAGNGYTSALALFGDARATADWYLSGAVAIAGPRADETATASFGGLALAVGMAGLPEDPIDVLDLLGGKVYHGSANALPGGVALVFNVGYNGSATALGGYSSAVGTSFPVEGLANKGTVCTALYGTASLTNLDGSNVSSCTSVLFLFQQSQQGDGPVNYSIKNPFSLRFTSPLTGLQNVVGAVDGILPEGLLPDEVVGLFDLGFQPEFTSDLIRIVMTDDGPRFETDIFDDLKDLFALLNPAKTLASVTTTAENTDAAAYRLPNAADTVFDQGEVESKDAPATIEAPLEITAGADDTAQTQASDAGAQGQDDAPSGQDEPPVAESEDPVEDSTPTPEPTATEPSNTVEPSTTASAEPSSTDDGTGTEYIGRHRAEP
ncbi:hypothetical protein [Gordonia humi]|uniref:PE-PPE domain-containing protein n=1 Tax=Gordonia humi TaxID=686429 RepID=A0A840EXH3_9ACTN|nr:hypothetical protein [Gordonia humi]MBB4133619.1 hypothetical protein [Gordonia humi]